MQITMKTIPNLFFLCFCSFLLITCNSGETDDVKGDNSNKAVGTYKGSDADKEKWGDFQLVLEIDKATYLYKDKILTSLKFNNIGTKTIKLDKVVSVSQMNNPPNIDIWTADGRKYNVFKVVNDLTDNVNIEPKKSIVLMQFDLTDVGGIVFQKDTAGGYTGYKGFEYPDIGSEFTKDTYYMCAGFFPVPQIYGCMTDTLMFVIE